MRSECGDDFWLMYDCWMSLDVEYATRLAQALSRASDLKWIEEALPPDDYWGYAELRRNVPRGMLVTTGEHEATRWGFRMLLEMECCDMLQPDVGWCGGITELIKISALADARGKLVVPHGSIGLQLSLRDHAAQQSVRRVPDDGAEGGPGRADVPPAAARRAGAGERTHEGVCARHARLRCAAESGV